MQDRSGSLRRPSSTERELLMGFKKNFTQCAMKSGEAKSDPRGLEVMRQSLLGNSFHVEVVAWLVAHLRRRWGYLDCLPSIASIRAALHPELRGAVPAEAPSRGFGEEQLVVLEHLRRLDTKGCDVRLDTGVVVGGSGWPRQPMDVGLWAWQVVHGWPFKDSAHINELELRAFLSALKWRLRRRPCTRRRMLHLLDSQVSIGVLCKGRSSSHLLNRVVHKVDAVVLAAQVHMVFGFVRSEANPADGPSRWFDTGQHGA